LTEPTIFVDASVFLGMHHRDVETRDRCLTFFRRHLASDRVIMNYEQIGICDAVIWRQNRQVQDAYYPFMDRLHSDMAVQRSGYVFEDICLAREERELRGLRAEQALLAAQVLRTGGSLATRDPVLRRLLCLRTCLFDLATAASATSFPAELETLYESSRCYLHTDET
jgi:predicted nucleic acid-binding protein